MSAPESKKPFGDTALGAGTGCALIVLAFGVGIALMIFALNR